MNYTLLWTDFFIYLLLAIAIIFYCWARTQKPLQSSWQHIMRSKQGSITLLILLTFVLIGLADSIHFKTNITQYDHSGDKHKVSQVYSLLDVIIQPLGQEYEKTYSAPFSQHLYSKALITTVNGVLVRDHPQLRYVKTVWITGEVLKALGLALGLVASLMIIFAGIASRKNSSLKKYLKQTQWGWTTLFTIFWVIFSIAFLAQHYHVLGTDKIGQDVLYQCIKSIRTGLVIGTLTTLIMLPFALLCGMLAGYFGGWVDDLIQYVYTTLSSIPSVLLISAAVLVLQITMNQHPEWFDSMTARADVRLLALCAILGLTSWTSLCRLLRGECLKLREKDYVQAAKVLGVTDFKILLKHLLPNVLHIVLITVVLDFSGLVLAEAVLSYVGVGVDPATMSWGNMINSARLELARDPIVWWPLLGAFIFMFTLVLAANLFADVVRDAFDPRVKQ